MDSKSLDRCIQTALSALYPPFQATSPTLLCQVLSAVESCYRGDGLRYLFHFLLPAKQFLVNLQRDACLQYSGLLFHHEGWPLCIHEKVVVQLCPLDPRLLRPGDFYLLVSPPAPPPAPPPLPRSRRAPAPSCPRLLLCSGSAGCHHAEQREVSEIALPSLFSMAFLDSVNRDREQRGASRLERCLLSAQGDVFRVPWEDLVYPQFNNGPRTSLKGADKSPVKHEHVCRGSVASKQEVELDQSAASSGGEDSEGEYVELAELPLPRFSPQKGSLTQSISLQHRARTGTRPPQDTPRPASTRSAPSRVGVASQRNLRQGPSSSGLPFPAPPRVAGTSGCQADCRASQEQEGGGAASGKTQEQEGGGADSGKTQEQEGGGAASGKSLESHTEPENGTGQRTEVEEETEEQKGRHGTVMSEEEEEEEEGEKLEGSERRLEEGLRLHIGAAEEDESQETKVESKKSEEEEDDDLEEGEVDEELQLHQYSFSNVLLRSGAVCLPGTRDRSGRALLTVGAAHAVWSNPDCDRAELLQLLLYYASTLRKEVRAKGLTVLVDARRAAPAPALFSALGSLHENTPGCIHSVLLLVNKDSPPHAATQVEVLSSLKSLHKRVELQKLPAEFGGSLSFSQSGWVCFRLRTEQLSRQCENVIRLLQKSINVLQDTPLPAAAQAYGWALEGLHRLAGITMEDCSLPDKCQAAIGRLEDYHRQHPPIPEARFQEMKEAAVELQGERSLRQWSFAWSKCQEAKQMFDRKMEVALRTRDSAHRKRSDSSLSKTSLFSLNKSVASSRRALSGLWGAHKTPSSSGPSEKDASPSSSSSSSSSLVTSTPIRSKHTPLLQRLLHNSSSEEQPNWAGVSSSSPSFSRLSFCSSSLSSSSSSSGRQHQRKTQSFDCPSTPDVSRYGPCPRPHNEPGCRGNTGVFIRGLEVSSTEAAGRTLSPRAGPHGWAGPGTGCLAADPQPRASKLRHIVEEMVTTEREYVRSLSYVLLHYFPEMDRADLPQNLRGKRYVVFGNLEKLLDFHRQFFLKELEACWKHPLRAPDCFLRHQEQFGLYALYSKNKPKSDALLANHGAAFFRRKQVQLGDKMDLSSYLLKPVQRMSKYALLLTDLMKEVGSAQEAELAALHAATDMVKFQLRHGNDLLAMDAIRDCDVNLKEQGQLIRQDEFTLWTGRKKCQRHVFLFEELVLFSKPKKMEGGTDVFIYKHSFKTADVGLTESAGDDGLRFEIWFRRRTSRNQTFVLQAGTTDVKRAWTADVACILWTQASRNKETRLKEMTSMGIGNKPFLDIQPSAAAISDRAVHYMMKSRGARTRASIAVSAFDHSHPFKRGAVTSDPATSGPSSSSLLGPLNLHLYSQPYGAGASFSTSLTEEDEQEHETSSQPSMTTESSDSSSRCLSGSTGSDSGCVSSHLQEAHEEASRPSCSPTSNTKHLSSRRVSPGAAAVLSPASIV
ncbi:pleckstrin homology domain-containing family G member 4B [Brachionichthys hirsutus]|uniref:pleckstrin homology domain-containing family G member 4B n=1 Tax=Brachionichthys hirsutus TaxID=412623 RepID=UPI003604E0D1